jgi:hypothetical protein
MFNMEMREKTLDKIRLENINYQVFTLIVKYLYTDDCEITLEVSLAIIGYKKTFSCSYTRRLTYSIELNGAF